MDLIICYRLTYLWCADERTCVLCCTVCIYMHIIISIEDVYQSLGTGYRRCLSTIKQNRTSSLWPSTVKIPPFYFVTKEKRRGVNTSRLYPSHFKVWVVCGDSYSSRILERTLSLRFLGIILRVLRLEFLYKIFTVHSSSNYFWGVPPIR